MNADSEREEVQDEESGDKGKKSLFNLQESE